MIQARRRGGRGNQAGSRESNVHPAPKVPDRQRRIGCWQARPWKWAFWKSPSALGSYAGPHPPAFSEAAGRSRPRCRARSKSPVWWPPSQCGCPPCPNLQPWTPCPGSGGQNAKSKCDADVCGEWGQAVRAQAIGMVDPARWRGHLWRRYAGFSDSPSIALGRTSQRYSGSFSCDSAPHIHVSPFLRPKGNRLAPAAQTVPHIRCYWRGFESVRPK